MTVEELVDQLNKLTAESQRLEICFMDEVWLRKVNSINIENGNEFGIGEDYQHVRLS